MALNEEQPLLLPDSKETILVRPGPPSPQSDAENIVRHRNLKLKLNYIYNNFQKN